MRLSDLDPHTFGDDSRIAAVAERLADLLCLTTPTSVDDRTRRDRA